MHENTTMSLFRARAVLAAVVGFALFECGSPASIGDAAIRSTLVTNSSANLARAAWLRGSGRSTFGVIATSAPDSGLGS